MIQFDSRCRNIIKTVDTKYKFTEIFNMKTGYYMRSGIIDKEGRETKEDPFMRSFPDLLDIGIMGGCTAADLCKVDCYQGARSNDPNKNMKLDDYEKIIAEGAKKGLHQVALGGAGNPNDHQDFENILRLTTDHGIIPNYTTAGIGLTDSAIKATKKHCGAVAVSWHYAGYSVEAINRFLLSGCKTSIHFVLSNKTIDTAIQLLKTHKLPYTDTSGVDKAFDLETHGINAIIFLMYKPVGCGKKENVLTLTKDNEKIKEFFSMITGEHPFKIGFDSCTIPAVLNNSDKVDPQSTDTCEGGRFSAYINADMIMVPCSFDQELKWGVDLRKHTVEEAWESDQFADFRKSLRNSCPGCKNRELCMGGCPIKNEIVLCDKPERLHTQGE